MPSEEMKAWIAALAASDARARASAARAIFDAGTASAQAATRAWREDAGLVRLFTGEPTVGVAVLPEPFERIRQANGSPALANVPPDQDAREFELHFPGGVSLDVLTTRRPHGPGAIARFLDRRGEGIQQVELPVSDVNRASALLREHFSITPLYRETRDGADGTRVNFFLIPVPASSGSPTGEKILIELVQAATERDGTTPQPTD